LSIIQGPFSVAPCQTLILRYAPFSSPYGSQVPTSGRHYTATWLHEDHHEAVETAEYLRNASQTDAPQPSASCAPSHDPRAEAEKRSHRKGEGKKAAAAAMLAQAAAASAGGKADGPSAAAAAAAAAAEAALLAALPAKTAAEKAAAAVERQVGHTYIYERESERRCGSWCGIPKQRLYALCSHAR
jgi:hypothetical protein